MKKTYRNIILLTFVLFSCAFISPHKGLNEYGKWLEFHSLKNEHFVKSETEVERKMIWSDYGLTNDYIELFQHFFIHSPDSNHFIDLDTYSLVLEEDKNGNLYSYGSGVDIKIQLVSTVKMTSTTLLFCGTECYPETTIWRNNSRLEIFGFKINQDDNFVPTIWKIDIKNMLFTEYSNKKIFSKMPESYSQERRLKEVEFKE